MFVATLLGTVCGAAGLDAIRTPQKVDGSAHDRLGLARDLFGCVDQNGCRLVGSQVIVVRDDDEIIEPEEGATMARFHFIVSAADENSIDGLRDDLGTLVGAAVTLMPSAQETASHMSTVRFTSIRQASSPRPGTQAAFLDLPVVAPDLAPDPLLQPVRLGPEKIMALVREGILEPAYATGAKTVRIGNLLDPRRYPLALVPSASPEAAVAQLLAGNEANPAPGPNVFNIVRATSLEMEFGRRKRTNHQVSLTFEPTSDGLGNPTYARVRLALFAALRGGVAVFADPTAKPDVY